jgi:hypothetical protein
MIEFVALAPKTYGYRCLDINGAVDIPENDDADWYKKFGRYVEYEGKLYPVKEVVKVKGFRLHAEAGETINFDGLLSLLTKQKTSLQARQLQFNYDRKDGGVMTSCIKNKVLIMDYGKGHVGADNVSYPFGAEDYKSGGGEWPADGDRRTGRGRDDDDDEDVVDPRRALRLPRLNLTDFQTLQDLFDLKNQTD